MLHLVNMRLTFGDRQWYHNLNSSQWEW